MNYCCTLCKSTYRASHVQPVTLLMRVTLSPSEPSEGVPLSFLVVLGMQVTDRNNAHFISKKKHNMSTQQHKILVQGGAGHAGLHILKSLCKGLKVAVMNLARFLILKGSRKLQDRWLIHRLS